MSGFGYTRYGQAFGVAANDAGTRISDKLMEATDRLAVALHELFAIRAGAGGSVIGLENTFTFLYPFVGGTQVSHSINLADPSKNRIFFEDDTTLTHNQNGVTGPGNAQLFGFEGATAADAYCTFGVYNRSSAIADGYQLRADMGGATGALYGIQCKRAADSNSVFYLGTRDGDGWMVIAVTNAQGFYSGMRVTDTASYAYKNGALIGSNALTGGIGSTALFYIFGGSAHNLAFVYLTRAVNKVGYLSSVQHGTLYTIVQKFQIWCGRQV